MDHFGHSIGSIVKSEWPCDWTRQQTGGYHGYGPVQEGTEVWILWPTVQEQVGTMSRCISHSVMCLAVFGEDICGERHWWSLAGSRLVRHCHGDPDYQWQPSQQDCSSSPNNTARSRVVKHSCAHCSAQDDTMSPKQNTSDGTCSNNTDQGVDNLPMMPSCTKSTCTGEYLVTGYSPRPSHPQPSGAWMAAARWLTIASPQQGSTSSTCNFAVNTLPLCIQRTCSGRCSCRQHNFVCTELCHCAGDEDRCQNTQPTGICEDVDEK